MQKLSTSGPRSLFYQLFSTVLPPVLLSAASLFSAVLVLPLSLMMSSESFCGEGPLNTADYLWQFAADHDSNGKLVEQGPVLLGTTLTGEPLAESIRRGGDGTVARFSKGGYLSFEPDSDFAEDQSGTERTFCVRFRSDVDQDSYPLCSRHGGHERLAWNFFCHDHAWGFELGTTENQKLLDPVAPLCETRDPAGAATQWHDLIARVTAAKVELFLDGRCYDEDFLLGQLRVPAVGLLFGAQYEEQNQIVPGFSGDLDYVAVWNRSLSDDEIAFLSGGKDRMDSRCRTDRGNGEPLQYWRPPNRYGVGDCMPFSRDGVFHMMYLLDRGHHSAKNGFGAHQWIQATSTDLVHWRHQPFVVPIDDQNEGSICTGSMFVHDGKYYAFYANRAVKYVMPDGSTRSCFGLICVSTSDDGIHFTKSDRNPLFYLPDDYGWGTRDPVVFEDPRSGRFQMYVTTSRFGLGCLAHLSSDDLTQWTLEEPVYTPYEGEPECSDVFQWGGTWYLLVGHGNGRYRVSDSPLGPWERPAGPDIVMPGVVNVPKTAPWQENRRLVCAWSREHGFGGHVVFHELVRRDDGSLGEKFVAEMIPESDAPLVQETNVTDPQRQWERLPGNLRIQMTWSFDPAVRDSLAGCEWTLADGKKLVVEPGRRLVRLGDFALECVDFSSGKMCLDLVIQDDLVDLDVNGDRAVIDTLPVATERTISLQQKEPGRFRLDSLTVSPLVRQP